MSDQPFSPISVQDQNKKEIYETGSMKKPFSSPQIVAYGYLRDLTLGSTGGVTESGGNGDGWHWD